MVLPHL